MKSRILALALALATVALSAQVTNTDPVPQPAGSIKVSFWFGLTGVNGDVVKALVNKYNASQSKYWIDAVSQPDYDATINKLNTSLAGGELPNVVQVYDIGTQRMIDTKKVVPVQDLIEKDKLDIIKDIEPAVAGYYTIGGKLYSMPFNSSTPVMYFDRNAFKEAGLPLDKKVWTWDDVYAAAKKLVKKDASGKIVRYGIGFTLYSWILEEEIATQAALFSSPNNGREGRSTKVVFNGPEGAKWLDFLKKLNDDGVGKNYGIDGGANSQARDAAYVNGEVSMTFNSIAGLRGYLTNAKTAGKNVDVGVAYIPRAAGSKGGVIIGGASLWITNTGSTDQQAGAWDFVKYVTTPEAQAFFSSNTGYYPIRKAAYNVKEMKDTLAMYPQFSVAVDQLHDSPKMYPTQGGVIGTFVKARANIQAAMEQFLSGKIATAQAALDQAAKQTNSELEEYNASMGY